VRELMKERLPGDGAPAAQLLIQTDQRRLSVLEERLGDRVGVVREPAPLEVRGYGWDEQRGLRVHKELGPEVIVHPVRGPDGDGAPGHPAYRTRSRAGGSGFGTPTAQTSLIIFPRKRASTSQT